uniref:Uncharacterized protein n=1 Tax=Helicotheca tamesis TaxID=374047 RepID=A0A7S2MJ65_9STRA|mmetsp:Transcript_16915/g.23194  ORF Transcript_16915/g.23194 Transcript_16915/m.23194 type:complete len:409 (+) Transcript_16915:171-1397(+)|eukprot:CAMPEP_0185740712 /NCGR_PEP_ID=MMETSP1171-20130828/38463_1 /TAXON_ID=374046 /ORGANISM="Helicotheca tamensis, Strain CCMP826" /LENGTH=408 /DNA_ID=CAMNT_0028412627 /DNA_START=131 /DNA_END=1357 /DNA_ORIENTATION=+
MYPNVTEMKEGARGRKRSREHDGGENNGEDNDENPPRTLNHTPSDSIKEVDDWGITDSSPSSSLSSVESLLSVPIDFILREIVPTTAHHTLNSNRRARRTLLSRGEACALIKTSQLSVEMDVLLSVAAQAMDKIVTCRQYQKDLLQIHNNHYLRPILPLLDVHGGKIALGAIDHVAREVGRVMTELASCCVTIRQFAEQNWSVAESLFDTLAETGGGGDSAEYDDGGGGGDYVRAGTAKRRRVPGRDLAKEKRVVAEVEEAVCDRIDALVGMAAVLPTDGNEGDGAIQNTEQFGLENVCLDDAFELATDNDTGHFLPLSELCKRLLGEEDVSSCSDKAPREHEKEKNRQNTGEKRGKSNKHVDDGSDDKCSQSSNARPDTTGSIDNAAAALAGLASSRPSISPADTDG